MQQAVVCKDIAYLYFKDLISIFNIIVSSLQLSKPYPFKINTREIIPEKIKSYEQKANPQSYAQAF